MAQVLKDSQETSNDSEAFANGTGNLYRSTSFTAGSSYTLIRAALGMTKTGVPSRTFDLRIYSDNGSDVPDTLLATSTNTINMSDLVSSLNWTADFSFSGLSIVSGTKYHLVPYCATYDVDNYVYWNLNAGVASHSTRYSGNGTSWTAYDTSSQGLFRTYYDDAGGGSIVPQAYYYMN
jgi:hypothetical protein